MKAKKRGKQKVKMYEKLSKYNENTKPKYFYIYICVVCL